MISLSVSVLSLFLELLSWPLADLDKTLSKSVKDRIIRSSSAVDLANGMSPSYSSYASPKRRSPQMAAASRMMPGATYSLRKNSVCSVFSSRCVMAVSHSKKGCVICQLHVMGGTISSHLHKGASVKREILFFHACFLKERILFWKMDFAWRVAISIALIK